MSNLNTKVMSVVQEIPIIEVNDDEPVAVVVTDNRNKVILGRYYVGTNLRDAMGVRTSIQRFLDKMLNEKENKEILSAKVLKYDRFSLSNEVDSIE